MRNVVYVVQDEAAAQFRYRVSNVMEAVASSKEWTAEYVLTEEVAKGWDVLSRVDMVVILRQAAKGRAILDFVAEAKRRGIPVLFDLDDLVFDFCDLPILMLSTNSRNVFYWAGYVFGIRRIAKMVDGFLVTNEFLGKKLNRSFGKPFRVIRNSLNQKQIEAAEKYAGKKGEDGFVVGYFSGSPTHTKDFRSVEPELVRFLNKYKDADLRIVGYMELSKEMKELELEGKVEVLPVVDYLELTKMMAEVDVNIAPLVVNDFTNCKSELKFFEAAAAGTTTIASPSFTFSRAIRDGENGFLAREGEWYKKLKFLYENPKENEKIAKQARKDAILNYSDSGEKFLEEVEGAFKFFAE